MQVALALALRLALQIDLGPEFDSNSNRVELPPTLVTGADATPQPIASFLLRSTVRGKLAYQSGDSSLKLSLDGGFKAFFDPAAQPQDEIVIRFTADYRLRLGRRAAFNLGTDYHDAYQWNLCPETMTTLTSVYDTSCHRDFRLAGLHASVVYTEGAPSLAIEGTVRGYEWKPDEDLSFVGVGASVTPALRVKTRDILGKPAGSKDDSVIGNNSDWILSASGRVEWRGFHGPRLLTVDDDSEGDSSPRRSDLVGTLSVSLTYVGPIIASAGYLVEADQSNSAGNEYLYQAMTLSLVASLPARITFALRGQLLFFANGTLPASLAVEDENRNSVVVDLSRDLPHGFTASARYAVYRNGTGDDSGTYLRQTMYLGVAYRLPR